VRFARNNPIIGRPCSLGMIRVTRTGTLTLFFLIGYLIESAMEKDFKKTFTAILILSLLLLISFLIRWTMEKSAIPDRDSIDLVLLEVQGDVPKPGIYLLDRRIATVASAAAAAEYPWQIPGEAARQKISSGQSLAFFRKQERTIIQFGRMPGAAILAYGLKLDLNSASVEELQLIPHMSQNIAMAIVNRRRAKNWELLEELVEINGVGPKTAQKLEEYLEISPAGSNRAGQDSY